MQTPMRDQFRERLANLVCSLRSDRSQQEFADLIGVSKSAVQSLESQKNLPSLETFFKLADYEKILPEELLARLNGRTITSEEITFEDFVTAIDKLSAKQLAKIIYLATNRLEQMVTNK